MPRQKNLKNRYDLNRVLKSADGNADIIVATGRLSMKIPALAKSPKSGKYVSPTFRVDEKGNLQNFFQSNGVPLPLYVVNGDKESVWEQPEMVGKTKEKNLYLIVGKGNDKPEFYELRLWDGIAKYVHQWCDKGDLVVVIARKTIEKSPSDNKEKTVWVVENLQKMYERNKKSSNQQKLEKENKEETVKNSQESEQGETEKTSEDNVQKDGENDEFVIVGLGDDEDDDLPF